MIRSIVAALAAFALISTGAVAKPASAAKVEKKAEHKAAKAEKKAEHKAAKAEKKAAGSAADAPAAAPAAN